MLKYVLLDLDDTILDFKKGEKESILEILKFYGISDNLASALKDYLLINAQVWKKIEQGGDKKFLLGYRFTKIFKKHGIDVNGMRVNYEYQKKISNNFHLIKNADLFLDKLKHYRLILIAVTNGLKYNQINRLKHTGLLKKFDACFISEDIGHEKPSSAFFEPIKNQYPDLSYENSMLIGDNLMSDVKGANNIGIKSIWYNPEHKKNNSGEIPTFEVTDYNEIIDIIKEITL